MSKIYPFFELEEKRYEIKPTRYLLAEYNKMSNETDLSAEDKTNAIKAQSLITDIRKYAEKTMELEERFFETFDEQDQRKYLMAKSMYDKALDDLARLEAESGSTAKLQKTSIDLLEKIAIKGLAEQHFNMDEALAKKTWEKFVDTLPNQGIATEWLTYMSECLFEDENEVESNSFLHQMRKKAEEKANNRRKMTKK